MRILYSARAKIPSKTASSINVMNMCSGFSKLGHEVILLARKGEFQVKNSFDYYGVKENFILKKFDKSQSSLGSLPFYFSKLPNIVEKYQPDVCYARHFKTLSRMVTWDLPLFFETHMPGGSFFKECLRWMTFTSENFRQLIVSNKNLKRYFTENYSSLDDNRVFVAPPASPEPKENQRVNLPGAEEALDVGYVGSLNPNRGIERILKISEKCPEFNFQIVGGMDDKLNFWKNQSQERKNVFFHGHVEPKIAMKYRNSMDILLAPYQTRTWGTDKSGNRRIESLRPDFFENVTSLKLVEYLAAGKPILVSDFAVFREIVNDGKTALLCDPENSDDWIDKLYSLKSDENFRKELGRKARQEWKEKYSYRSRCEKISTMIKEKI